MAQSFNINFVSNSANAQYINRHSQYLLMLISFTVTQEFLTYNSKFDFSPVFVPNN